MLENLGNDIVASFAHTRSGETLAFSLDGTVLAVGEPGADQIRLFEWDENDTTWTQRGEPIRGPTGSHFGASLAMSDDGRTVAAGGPNYGTFGSTGIVQVYRWLLPHERWEMLLEVKAEVLHHSAGMHLGYDVALSSSGQR